MKNEQIIWNFLMEKIGNPYGVAGLMGNLWVESHLDPKLLQGSYARKWGITSEEYARQVDAGERDFIHDEAGYGLAQWTYWSRKEALLAYAKEQGVSISDLQMQLRYLWTELQKYKTVVETLKNATTVAEASDIVCKRFEKPLDQSEKALANRAVYGVLYYETFVLSEPAEDGAHVVITTNKVNIRVGNGTQYKRYTQANTGDAFEYVATAENGWYAIVIGDRVCWVSGEFSRRS